MSPADTPCHRLMVMHHLITKADDRFSFPSGESVYPLLPLLGLLKSASG